eukprot:10766554-Alexandrium_andersonii.AAC.1
MFAEPFASQFPREYADRVKVNTKNERANSRDDLRRRLDGELASALEAISTKLVPSTQMLAPI